MFRKILQCVLCLSIYCSVYAQNIVQGEYYFDSEPGVGNGIALAIGLPSDSLEIQHNISVTGLTEGLHTLFIRYKDDAGKWGITAQRPFIIDAYGEVKRPNIIEGEYYYNVDPSIGGGQKIEIDNPSDSLELVVQASTSGMSVGQHAIFFRFKNELGAWSHAKQTSVVIGTNAEDSASNFIIQRGEYFYNEDPGIGKGTALEINANSVVEEVLNISAPKEKGLHTLWLRFQNENGAWSHAKPTKVIVQQDVINNNKTLLNGVEYFFNKDSGVGTGEMVLLDTPEDSASLVIEIPAEAIDSGFQTLFLRPINEFGVYGFSKQHLVIKREQKSISRQVPITGIEVFLDGNDQGIGLNTIEEVDTVGVNAIVTFTIKAANLQVGDHFVNVRPIDDSSRFGFTKSEVFNVCLGVAPEVVTFNDLVCFEGYKNTARLVAKGSLTERYHWFTGISGNSKIHTENDSVYNKWVYDKDTTFWVSGESVNGCLGPRSSVSVEVVDSLYVPVFEGNIVRCGAGPVTIEPMGAPESGGYRWYDYNKPDSLIYEGVSYLTDSIYTSRLYSISTISQGANCESEDRVTPTIVIDNNCETQDIFWTVDQDVVFEPPFIFPLDGYSLTSTGDTLQLTYTVLSGPGRVSNDNLELLGLGTISIVASQPGGGGVFAAEPITKNIKVVATGATLLAEYNSPICEGQVLQLTASSILGATYEWIYPNGDTVHTRSPKIFNASVNHAERYVVKAKTILDTLTSFVDVVVFPRANPVFMEVDVSGDCQNQEVDLIVSGGIFDSYKWYFNANEVFGATDSLHQALESGIYSAEATDSNGCSSYTNTQFVDVDELTIPTITANLDSLRSSSALIYQWYINGYHILNTDKKAIPLFINGVYNVTTISDLSSGCAVSSDSIVINIPILRELSLAPGDTVVDLDDYSLVLIDTNMVTGSNSPICEGEVLQLSALANDVEEFYWYYPNGEVVNSRSPKILNTSLEDEGIYYVVALRSNDTLVQYVEVDINAKPAVIYLDVDTLEQCQYKSYELHVSGGEFSEESYQWFIEAKPIFGEVSNTLVAPITGIYSATAKDSNGCVSHTNAQFLDLEPLDRPEIEVLENPLRLKSSPAAEYQWYINDLFIVDGNSQELDLVANGIYKVKITSDNLDSCKLFSEILLVNDPTLEELRFDGHDGGIDLSLLTELVLIPNPASNELTVYGIDIEKNKTVNIYNEVGVLVEVLYTTDNGTRIDVGGYVQGLYYVEYLRGSNYSRQKFMVIK